MGVDFESIDAELERKAAEEAAARASKSRRKSHAPTPPVSRHSSRNRLGGVKEREKGGSRGRSSSPATERQPEPPKDPQRRSLADVTRSTMTRLSAAQRIAKQLGVPPGRGLSVLASADSSVRRPHAERSRQRAVIQILNYRKKEDGQKREKFLRDERDFIARKTTDAKERLAGRKVPVERVGQSATRARWEEMRDRAEYAREQQLLRTSNLSRRRHIRSGRRRHISIATPDQAGADPSTPLSYKTPSNAFELLLKKKRAEYHVADTPTMERVNHLRTESSMSHAPMTPFSRALASMPAQDAVVHVESELPLFGKLFVSYKDLGGPELIELNNNFPADGLTEDEFVNLFSRVVASPRETLIQLFQKMDANADGSLAWEEFTEFLLSETSTRVAMTRESRRLVEQRVVPSVCHRHMIDVVLPLPDKHLYLTCGRDSRVHLWDTKTMRCVKTLSYTDFGANQAKKIAEDKAKTDHLASAYAVDTTGAEDENEPALDKARAVAKRDARAMSRQLFHKADSTNPSLQNFDLSKRAVPVSHRLCQMPAPHYLPWVAAAFYEESTEELVIGSVDGHVRVFDTTGLSFRTAIDFAVPSVPMSVSVMLMTPRLKDGDEDGLPDLDALLGRTGQTDKALRGRIDSMASSAASRGQGIFDDDDDDANGGGGAASGNEAGADRKDDERISLEIRKPEAPPPLGIIVGTVSGELYCYSLDSEHKVLRKHKFHTDGVTQAEFLPDLGVLSASLDGTLVLVDEDRFDLIRRFEGHTKGIHTFAYSAKSRLIASSGLERVVLIWNPYLSTPIARLDGHAAPVFRIICNDVHSQFISTSDDKTIKVWDVHTLTCIQTIVDDYRHEPENMLTASVFDQEATALVTCGSHLRVWPVDFAHKASNDEETLMTGRIVGVAFSTPFRLVVSVDDHGMVNVWNMSSGACTFQFYARHDSQVTAMTLDQMERRLVTAAHDGTVRLWNFNNGLLLHEFAPRTAEVTQLVFLQPTVANDKVMVGSDCDGALTFWPTDADPGAREIEIQGHQGDSTCVAASAKHIVTGGTDGTVVFYSADSCRLRTTTPMPAPLGMPMAVESLLFLPKRKVLLVGTQDGYVHVLQQTSGTVLAGCVVNVDEAVTSMATNLDCTRLMLGNALGNLTLWNVTKLSQQTPKSMYQLRRWKGHKGEVSSIACLDAPSVFISASNDSTLRVWDWNGKALATLGDGPWPKTLPHEVGSHQQIMVRLGLAKQRTGTDPHAFLTRSDTAPGGLTAGRRTLSGANVFGGSSSSGLALETPVKAGDESPDEYEDEFDGSASLGSESLFARLVNSRASAALIKRQESEAELAAFAKARKLELKRSAASESEW